VTKIPFFAYAINGGDGGEISHEGVDPLRYSATAKVLSASHDDPPAAGEEVADD
jgi:hypothetical protein